MGFFDFFLLGSRPPRCPITPDDRLWIENSFAWFAEQLGGDIVRNRPVILPTGEFFPKTYVPDWEGVDDLLSRVSRLMDVDRESLLLDIYSEDEIPNYGFGPHSSNGAAGHLTWDESTRRWVISLNENTMDDPMAVVAVMAHETAHVHLIGFGRVDPEKEEDHEPLTDLLAIYYGFGVFVGNSAFRSDHIDNGTTSTWSAKKLGYLPEPMIGFALALTALAKQQTSPDWIEHLAYGVRKPFEKSLAFLLHEREQELGSLLE